MLSQIVDPRVRRKLVWLRTNALSVVTERFKISTGNEVLTGPTSSIEGPGRTRCTLIENLHECVWTLNLGHPELMELKCLRVFNSDVRLLSVSKIVKGKRSDLGSFQKQTKIIFWLSVYGSLG